MLSLPILAAKLLLLLLPFGTSLSHAYHISAWFTDLGPQVIWQNETTGDIHYTTCNSVTEPTYSPGNVLKFRRPPKKNTPLAGAGYYDSDSTHTVASIYYTSEKDKGIINALFNCNTKTGLFEPVDDDLLTVPSISPDSGLAAFFHRQAGDYRIYYHDENMAVNEVVMTHTKPGSGSSKPSSQWSWQHKGVISQDPQGSSTIAVGYKGNEVLGVVTVRDMSNMEVISSYDFESNWRIETFPHPLSSLPNNLPITQDTKPSDINVDRSAKVSFTLPYWNSRTASIGTSVDIHSTQSVWYIGLNRVMYQTANDVNNRAWGLHRSQNESLWPLADSPNSPIAVTQDDTGSLRIYYIVDGWLAQVRNLFARETGPIYKWNHITTTDLSSVRPTSSSSSSSSSTTTTTTSSGTTDPTSSTDILAPSSSSTSPTTTATGLPTFPTLTTGDEGKSNHDNGNGNADADGGLSIGARIGLSVGICLGAILLITPYVLLLLRRRKRKINATTKTTASESDSNEQDGGNHSRQEEENPSPRRSSSSSSSSEGGGTLRVIYDHYARDQKNATTADVGDLLPYARNISGIHEIDDSDKPVELPVTVVESRGPGWGGGGGGVVYELSNHPYAFEMPLTVMRSRGDEQWAVDAGVVADIPRADSPIRCEY